MQRVGRVLLLLLLLLWLLNFPEREEEERKKEMTALFMFIHKSIVSLWLYIQCVSLDFSSFDSLDREATSAAKGTVFINF